MQIRSALLAGLILSMAIVLTRLAVLSHSTNQNERIDRLQRQAEQVARDAASLQALSHDYILRRSARAAQQWRATQRTLLAALSSANLVSGDALGAVSELTTVAEGLPALFETLPAGPEGENSFADGADILVDNLVYQTRLVSEAAFDLGDAVAQQRRQVRETELYATIAANLGFLAVTLALTAWLARRLIRPVNRLHRAAQAIADGQMAARSEYRAKDELGTLSSQFDGMADALRERERSLAEARRHSEALLNALHMHAIVSVADRQGRIIEVNDAFCRISGYSREELLGQDHRILNSGTQPAEFWRSMWRSVGSGQAWRGTVCNRAKDGSLYWVDSFIAPFMNADGRIERYISIRVDVSEAKALERRLMESERFLRKATDALPMRVTYVDTQHVFRFANRAALQNYGRAREEILGRPCADVLGADPDHPVRQHMLLALAGREQQFETRQDVGGVWRHFEMRMIPDIDEDGTVRGVFSTGFDITERKRAAIELSETSTLLKTVLDSATEVAIIVTETDGRIRLFNPGAERLLGLEAQAVVGSTGLHSMFDAAELGQVAETLAGMVGRAVPVERVLFEPTLLGQPRVWTCVRTSDTSRRSSLVVTAMSATDGSVLGYLAVAYDVTQQEQYESMLRQAVATAQRADLAKSAFLANMSHEIRTPMNGVLGLIYLLDQTRLNAEQGRYLRKMRVVGNTLLRLLDDILDLSKIEAGELALESVPFKLRHLVRDVTELGRTQSEAKGLNFAVQIGGELPSIVMGDPVRLGQILNNLVSNAVKFTEQGSVTLRVQPLPAAPGRATLRFVVADTGIGIDASVREQIFRPFAQADTSVTRRFGGTGLGLSIVRHLVDRLDGSLSLRSSPGAGSEFTVELSFVVASPAALTWEQLGTKAVDRAALVGVRVLVVDDSDINRDVAERILQLRGATVTTAVDGLVAIEQLRENPRGFDVVLMDVQMPKLDGYAATRRIRDDLGLVALPVIALTAATLSSELEHARDAGMTGFVSKPFEPDTLVRTVLGHVTPGATSAASADNDASGQPPRPDWPVIEGIDTKLAQSHMAGDLSLFADLLAKLLGDDPPPEGSSPEDLARAMHRLRGAAATLGATPVAELAGEVEALLKSGNVVQLRACQEALEDELALLRRHAQPVLSRIAQAHVREARRSGDLPSIDALARLLQHYDTAAVAHFDALQPELEKRLGTARFAQLRAHVHQLEFGAAVEVLSSAQVSGDVKTDALATVTSGTL